MSFQSPRVCLSVLVSLWALGATPATAENLDYFGKTEIALSPSSVSGIAINLPALFPQLCSGPPVLPSAKPLVQCYLVVTHEPGTLEHGGSYAAAQKMELFGVGSLDTPCGPWDTTLTLDPSLPQPASPFILEKRPDDPERGLFATVLEMNTNLHLENRDTGRTVDIPLLVGLGLSGPWVLAPSPESVTDKRLLLLTDREANQLISYENCVPAKVLNDPRFAVQLNDCRVCFESSAVRSGSGSGSGTQDQN